MIWQAWALLGISFIVVALAGRPFINWIRDRRVGQTVREEGPKSHYVKSGTPTFGGVLFTIPLLLTAAFIAFGLSSGIFGSEVAAAIHVPLVLGLYILGSAGVGFADDYVKVRISKKGINAKQKTIPMFALILFLVLYYLFFFPGGPVILLPFTNQVIAVEGAWKIVYGILAFLYLYYIGNSVNFTDGVDGLLSTVSVPVLITLAVLGVRLTAVSSGYVTLLSACLVGSLLAYLIYNRYPAKIFMGDTGSLAIGAMIAASAMFMGIPWILILSGVIYWVESLTVMIQMTYYRKTGGKRIFRMTPIHHHFELGGWSENKIVLVFTTVTVVGCLLTIAALWPYLG